MLGSRNHHSCSTLLSVILFYKVVITLYPHHSVLFFLSIECHALQALLLLIMACVSKSSVAPSNSFQRALDKFLRGLTDQQRHEFPACKLEDVWREVVAIQKKRGDQKNMRDMARLQKFLEAMSQYEKVVDVFLNTTPFLSYVWV